MKNCNLYGCLIKNILFSNNVAKVDTLTTLSVSLSNPNRNFTIFIFKILKICTILTVRHNDVMFSHRNWNCYVSDTTSGLMISLFLTWFFFKVQTMDYIRITEQIIILKNLNPIYSLFKEEESEMILFCRKLKAFLKKKW